VIDPCEPAPVAVSVMAVTGSERDREVTDATDPSDLMGVETTGGADPSERDRERDRPYRE
jgi:hypothetical protein